MDNEQKENKQLFNPYEALKEKPEAIVFSAKKEVDLHVDSYFNKPLEQRTKLENLFFYDETNPSTLFDREKVLGRLQKNGFLIANCSVDEEENEETNENIKDSEKEIHEPQNPKTNRKKMGPTNKLEDSLNQKDKITIERSISASEYKEMDETQKEPEENDEDEETEINELTKELKKMYLDDLPKQKPDIIKASSYYLTNRIEFIKNINELFSTYQPNAKETRSNEYDLLSHQKVVRDYMNLHTPYRGLLIYHSLGSGKSCTSIAVAEAMKTDKPIYILSPASLATNYWTELQKCGDAMYKPNQHWEFVSIEGQPDLIPILANALTMTNEQIKTKKGAWMMNSKKAPNFQELNADSQKSIQEQLKHMINQKYKPLHYNANDLASKIEILEDIHKRNPFDHATVVIDEAHNFVSNIIGNLKKTKSKNTSIYVKLYELLMNATNMRVVMLSGTPIINYPNEMGVMYNILRGYIYVWSIKLKQKTSDVLNTESLKRLLDNDILVYDYIDYSRKVLTITRNPYGFINVNHKKHITKKKHVDQLRKTATSKVHGGEGLYGIELDERGNISNDVFIREVKRILERSNKVEIEEVKLSKEKCLPDDNNEFFEMFIRPVTNYSDDADSRNAILKRQTISRRILGLTSYFRSPNESNLPLIIKNSDNEPFHEVRVPMSDFQCSEYASVRKKEIEKDKKLKTMRGAQKQVKNAELFQIASSYRSLSRAVCNFAFPNPPGRPRKKYKKEELDKETKEDEPLQREKEKKDENEKDDNVEEEEEGEDEDILEDGDVMDERRGGVKSVYEEEIKVAMEYLRTNAKSFFTPTNLAMYSPKMLEIFNNVSNESYDGLHLLYSSFLTIEGIGIFQEVLNTNGYQEFKIQKKNGKWYLDFVPDGRKCYVLYTGKETAETKEIMRNIFNGDWEQPNVPLEITNELKKISSHNLYGAVIKLFMITSAGAEGINLKNTRYVHIMEPYWHNVRLEQVTGRARRLYSHEQLPKSKRTVQVFVYMSVMSEKHKTDEKYKEIQINDLSKLNDQVVVTTDEYLYEISQMKQKLNNQMLHIMKESAMDCYLYESQHNKNLPTKEKLVCYGHGTFAQPRTFTSYPRLTDDVGEDVNDRTKVKSTLK